MIFTPKDVSPEEMHELLMQRGWPMTGSRLINYWIDCEARMEWWGKPLPLLQANFGHRIVTIPAPVFKPVLLGASRIMGDWASPYVNRRMLRSEIVETAKISWVDYDGMELHVYPRVPLPAVLCPGDTIAISNLSGMSVS